MFWSTKKKSILSILRDRELNVNYPFFFSNLKIVRELISSKNNTLYTTRWTENLREHSWYANGLLYFEDGKKCCSVNAISKETDQNRSIPFFSLENTCDKKLDSELLYSGNCFFEEIESVCRCFKSKRCICLSPFLLTISSDNWLYQHLLLNGKLIKKVYLNGHGSNVKKRSSTWDTYGERFSIFTEYYGLRQETENVKKSLTIFTTHPLEFFVRMEIKHSIFSNDVKSACVANQCLIINLSNTHTAIYSFDEFIRKGKLTEYRLGAIYETRGEIGSYPAGLPVNFVYNEAPPLLIKIESSKPNICFGDFPLHYITVHPRGNTVAEFRVTELETNIPIKLDRPWLSMYDADSDIITFHTDASGRIILKTYNSIDFYKVISHKDSKTISKQFSFQLQKKLISSHAMVLRKHEYDRPSRFTYRVLSFAYSCNLNIFAILIKHSNTARGYVNLYDNRTGEILRTVELSGLLICDGKYKIKLDLCAILIFDSNNHVHVFML